MKRAGSILTLLALMTLAACSRSPLKGGKRIAENVYWRLNQLGEGEEPAGDSDSVFVRVRVARPAAPPGSLYSTERWFGMGPGLGTTFLFRRLCQGDSATVLLPAKQVPWAALGASVPPPAADTGWVQLELSMREIRTPEESRARAKAALMARTQADEERIIRGFLGKDTIPWKEAMGVWYRLDSLAERGPRVQSGELVTLAYTASFLDNGQVFDEQGGAEGGLTFRLGDPDQVIKGLEVAAHLLPAAGGSGTFILPSELAFGPKGSSSGIVPPWTPVLYRVTVVAKDAAPPA